MTLKTLDRLQENQPAYLLCDVSFNTENLVKINWYKDESLIDFTQLNATLNEDTRFLYFPKLSYKIHDGVYKCAVALKNGQRIDNEDNFVLKTLGNFNKVF